MPCYIYPDTGKLHKSEKGYGINPNQNHSKARKPDSSIRLQCWPLLLLHNTHRGQTDRQSSVPTRVTCSWIAHTVRLEQGSCSVTTYSCLKNPFCEIQLISVWNINICWFNLLRTIYCIAGRKHIPYFINNSRASARWGFCSSKLSYFWKCKQHDFSPPADFWWSTKLLLQLQFLSWLSAHIQV